MPSEAQKGLGTASCWMLLLGSAAFRDLGQLGAVAVARCRCGVALRPRRGKSPVNYVRPRSGAAPSSIETDGRPPALVRRDHLFAPVPRDDDPTRSWDIRTMAFVSWRMSLLPKSLSPATTHACFRLVSPA
ncbi:hypothetical protein BHE74_00013417 [Ensete ventricosum]|nr:hypothetical protein BHE74_00013417 [Ensete ventricosum]